MLGIGQTGATNAGNLLTSMGNANAAGTVGAANAWSNGLGNIGNAYTQNRLLAALSGGGQRGSGAYNFTTPQIGGPDGLGGLG
jgi:hypothetical protein